jgi:peptidoglycan-N-acetylglucosamine deacetylase
MQSAKLVFGPYLCLMPSNTKTKQAYLTIDDGPSPQRADMLEVLEQREIQAIFFSEGRCLEEHYELGLATLRAGHHLGNHSWHHPHFSNITLGQAKEEILRTDLIIDALYKEAHILRPGKWFRFPYGDKGDGRQGYLFQPWRIKNHAQHAAIQGILAELNYTQPHWGEQLPSWFIGNGLNSDLDCHWTFDVMEWALNLKRAPFSIARIKDVAKRINMQRPKDPRGPLFFQNRWLSAPSQTEIILMHDQLGLVEHFPRLIDQLRSHVHFCSLDQTRMSF